MQIAYTISFNNNLHYSYLFLALPLGSGGWSTGLIIFPSLSKYSHFPRGVLPRQRNSHCSFPFFKQNMQRRFLGFLAPGILSLPLYCGLPETEIEGFGVWLPIKVLATVVYGKPCKAWAHGLVNWNASLIGYWAKKEFVEFIFIWVGPEVCWTWLFTDWDCSICLDCLLLGWFAVASLLRLIWGSIVWSARKKWDNKHRNQTVQQVELTLGRFHSRFAGR